MNMMDGDTIIKQGNTKNNSLKNIADFTTVSGEVDNKTNPEKLYRRCGFEGDDIWYVLRK